jgi:hypothetical protein
MGALFTFCPTVALPCPQGATTTLESRDCARPPCVTVADETSCRRVRDNWASEPTRIPSPAEVHRGTEEGSLSLSPSPYLTSI